MSDFTPEFDFTDTYCNICHAEFENGGPNAGYCDESLECAMAEDNIVPIIR